MVIHRTKFLSAPLLALALAAGPGCARTGPAAAAPSVLSVPPAPPRVISVPPEPVTPVETATAEPPSEPRPTRSTRPSARADNGSRGAPTTTEPEPAPQAEVPAERPADPSPAAPVLRTPQTADESEAVRRVRTVLERAATLLAQVNPAGLTREARTQHDTARRFVDQSKQALLERNLVFASYLADKAETLARGLSR